jgi:acetyl esterase/lipase
MHKLIFIFLLLFNSFIVYSQETPTSDTATYKLVEFPTGYNASLNEVYTQAADWEGKLDVYFQINPSKPTPLIINIHGGGWNHGVKESQTGFNTFFKKGFAVANIEYRLTKQATAPAAVQDARCALIYMIKNAKRFNIDVNKIVVMGGSAGGHLALMTGLLANNSIFDNNCKGMKNIHVAAIIDKYGITDVWDWAYGKNLTSKSATSWLGDKKNDESFAKSVSPVNYLTKNSPPIFIVHGDADPTVPYQQSVDLHNKLDSLSVKNVFITVPGGLHGKFEKSKNTEINNAIIDFIFSLDSFKN